MLNKSHYQYLVFYALLLIQPGLSANILAVTTLASPSHHLWHKAYFLGLIEKGHNITVLGHDEEKQPSANFTMLTLEGVYDKIHKDFNIEGLVNDTPLQSLKFIWDWELSVCTYDLQTKAIETLLNYPKDYKFDLIIWDINSGRCLYPIIDRFKRPPLIATSPYGVHSFMDYIFGNHIFSYIPFYHVNPLDQSNIFERLANFFYIHVMNLSSRYYSIPREFEISKKFFGDKIRSIDEVERTMNLLISNNDPVVDYSRPLPPNIIPVAGIHIQHVKKLPKDIENILNETTHGVVLVAFGTNLNLANFGEIQRQAFFETFRRLPQTVLIKSPKLEMDIPENVILRKWLPQSDILAHPNVRLFITHGGALSTQEAMYHGVPIVGMPFYLDQHGNMFRINARKIGRRINYLEATFDVVYNTVTDVLNDPT
ncbi:hypothetical protein ILUMI_04855, partial [Ignelater luminosus]